MVFNQQIQSGPTPFQHPVLSRKPNRPTVWAVISDKSGAHILEKDGRHFNPVKEMENLQLIDDGLNNNTIGRGSAPAMAGRHKYGPSMTESRQNSIAFAREIILWLDKMRGENRFDEFVIAASPSMLGELLKNIQEPLRKCLVGQSNKNLMEFNGKDLEQELLKIIPGPMKE